MIMFKIIKYLLCILEIFRLVVYRVLLMAIVKMLTEKRINRSLIEAHMHLQK